MQNRIVSKIMLYCVRYGQTVITKHNIKPNVIKVRHLKKSIRRMQKMQKRSLLFLLACILHPLICHVIHSLKAFVSLKVIITIIVACGMLVGVIRLKALKQQGKIKPDAIKSKSNKSVKQITKVKNALNSFVDIVMLCTVLIPMAIGVFAGIGFLVTLPCIMLWQLISTCQNQNKKKPRKDCAGKCKDMWT